MTSPVDELPYSQLTLEELEGTLLALRARRIETKAPQPKVIKARTSRSPKVNEMDVSDIFGRLLDGLPDVASCGGDNASSH